MFLSVAARPGIRGQRGMVLVVVGAPARSRAPGSVDSLERFIANAWRTGCRCPAVRRAVLRRNLVSGCCAVAAWRGRRRGDVPALQELQERGVERRDALGVGRRMGAVPSVRPADPRHDRRDSTEAES